MNEPYRTGYQDGLNGRYRPYVWYTEQDLFDYDVGFEEGSEETYSYEASERALRAYSRHASWREE